MLGSDRIFGRKSREPAHAQALAEVGRMAPMIALQLICKQEAPDGESHELRSIAREQVAYMEAILSQLEF